MRSKLAGFLSAAALAAVFAACSGDTGPEDVANDVGTDAGKDAGSDTSVDPYPMDDDIRLNQIQVKGTHNSYKVQTDYSPPEWAETMPSIDVQLDELGVRQVEFDVHMTADGTLEVFHLAYMDPLSTCTKFTDCLGLVKTWSEGHPGHLPVVILVEPKDSQDEEALTLLGKLGVIESEILSVFPRESIITPDDVRGAHATIREALTTDGWPTLRVCRDRVMFIMLDSDQHRAENLANHPNLEGAIIFPRDGRGETWSAMLEIEHPEDPAVEAEITSAVQENYLVRTGTDDPQTPYATFQVNLEAALRSGAHLINTDHPNDTTVTTGDGAGYRMDIPGGTPARCNPQNAPEGCTPQLLENLD